MSFAYGLNNPVYYTDPSGHWVESAIDILSIGYDIYDISTNGLNWENGLSLAADVASLALPVVAGGGAMVRAAMHVDDAVDAARLLDKADDAADSGEFLYRAMKAGEDGLPEIGPSARELGARIPEDIPSLNGNVFPETGGMSVSPGNPNNLPTHRRPPEFGGTGRDPVWCISTCELGPELNYRPDPKNPTGHGFIEPAYPMSTNKYQQALGATRSNWILAAK